MAENTSTEDFYAPEVQTQDLGTAPQRRIQDPETAHEIAIIEKQQGREHSLAREAELLRQAGTGLTQEEENNITIMEGLQEKYPQAFEELIDSRGRKVLTMQTLGQPGSQLQSYRVFVTQEGVIGTKEVSGQPYLQTSDIDMANLIDTFVKAREGKENPDQTEFQTSLSLILSQAGQERISNPPSARAVIDTEKAGVVLRDINLVDESVRSVFKEALVQAQNHGVKAEQEQVQAERQMDPQAILKEL